MVQLARTQPRLTRPAVAHQRRCRGFSSISPLMALPGLILRLPTDAKMTASPCHAYALEAPLREELPEGFFFDF